ncbi:LOW QUALITY PROTEIN: uncharacterized protein T551_00381 [Pneumocystis jirovecii RU7]|uniref:Uncharacterized protein n=1 Tax=Pneumocystis jirovecii (strain RU7) TaxID=1408657 RepID=A0A0W4ZV85_PNEJ7|nr:LOW QUALITY PROTEIN: uncharacterized protein T551_00381 [Pneumocystis jirovecii RU7]KTW32290.1 LOW QUALITY PROTEIN: hypothetical protein T551_00381 [Pneumocystis jirovecii RU7]
MYRLKIPHRSQKLNPLNINIKFTPKYLIMIVRTPLYLYRASTAKNCTVYVLEFNLKRDIYIKKPSMYEKIDYIKSQTLIYVLYKKPYRSALNSYVY